VTFKRSSEENDFYSLNGLDALFLLSVQKKKIPKKNLETNLEIDLEKISQNLKKKIFFRNLNFGILVINFGIFLN
jgi:hypothetical protein